MVQSSVLAKGLAHKQVQNLSEQGQTTYIGDKKNVTMEVKIRKYITDITMLGDIV